MKQQKTNSMFTCVQEDALGTNTLIVDRLKGEVTVHMLYDDGDKEDEEHTTAIMVTLNDEQAQRLVDVMIGYTKPKKSTTDKTWFWIVVLTTTLLCFALWWYTMRFPTV